MIKYYEMTGVHNQELFSAFLTFLNPHSKRDLHSLFLYWTRIKVKEKSNSCSTSKKRLSSNVD